MQTPFFPGITKPSVDMQSVRDGRRSLPLVYVVDLAIARSIAAGTHLALPIAGTTFYADPIVDAAGVPIGGVATVHFQDQNLGAQGTPFTVNPQFIARIPFTQLLIENPAQPGRLLRIIYGIDLDFAPGINALVTIAGVVTTRPAGQIYGSKFTSTAALAGATNEQVFSAASNVNGATIYDAGWNSQNAAGVYVLEAFHAHTVAPAAYTDGDILVAVRFSTQVGANFFSSGNQQTPLGIVAGKGVWFRNSHGTAEASGIRSMLYTLN